MNLPFISVTPTKVLTFMVSSSFGLHILRAIYVPVYNVALHVRVTLHVDFLAVNQI